jgi:hypothetical protein
MPNLPVAIRRGVTALYSDDADDALKQQIGDLFAALGWAMWTVDEARLAAVGTVAGAGPAYAARFVRALAKAGEARGLSPEIASTIALETVLGTAWMAATANEAMDDIVKRVASPGGTTEAGLAVLDQALDELVGVTVRAAADRGAQLADDAPGVRVAMAASEEAKKKNLSLVSGLCWRYSEGVQETIKRIQDGQIGEIVAMQETYARGPYVLRERQPGWSEMEYQFQNWYHFNWLSGDDTAQSLIHKIGRA